MGSENCFELVNFLGFAFRLWIFPLWSCTEFRHINLLISSAWSWKKRKSKSWILVMGINLFWLHLTSVDNCKIHNQKSINWISPPDWKLYILNTPFSNVILYYVLCIMWWCIFITGFSRPIQPSQSNNKVLHPCHSLSKINCQSHPSIICNCSDHPCGKFWKKYTHCCHKVAYYLFINEFWTLLLVIW